MEKVDTLVIDKTGTLTEGNPKLTDVTTVGGFNNLDVLLLVATLERSSEHPVAAAIVKGAEDHSLHLGSAENFQSFPGQGIAGTVSGRQLVTGTAAFLNARGIDTTELVARADLLRQKGETVVLAAVNGKPAGVIAVSDPIKSSTREAVRSLRADGLRLLMLTGDNHTTAAAIARELGIDEFEAEVLPE
jgi:P-type Cu+ transporter